MGFCWHQTKATHHKKHNPWHSSTICGMNVVHRRRICMGNTERETIHEQRIWLSKVFPSTRKTERRFASIEKWKWYAYMVRRHDVMWASCARKFSFQTLNHSIARRGKERERERVCFAECELFCLLCFQYIKTISIASPTLSHGERVTFRLAMPVDWIKSFILIEQSVSYLIRISCVP